MFNKKIIAAVLAVSGMFINMAANAQAYVGATVGQARWNADCNGTTNCKTNDTSFNILGGYNFNANWGIEASYYSLGKIKANFTNVVTYGNVGNITGEMKATGIDLAGVYRTQFNNNWGMFAKLGIARTKGEGTIFLNNTGILADSKNSTNVMAGLGVTYAFTPNFAVRAEIDSRKADFTYTSGNITNFNIGVQAAF
ncbi:outer membrane beta-barrel protein [Undibacterium sp. TS12]|uniref:outer membrane beta-barrel protein n=1 Tax=Undibacterium sp. TS12 TaxID=2908202 RepID=UPI001F4D2775|nr:outer membrane beta-barrel protein [Undibacterium sp. TS12]MCH8619896.1 outer membrane beta-barrel protein [Undibacterium sp. TS12]